MNRVYQCTGCGNVIETDTNHTGEIYPTCTGRCRQIINPHTARERVFQTQTAHRYLRDADSGPVVPADELIGMTAEAIALVRVDDTLARTIQRAARFFLASGYGAEKLTFSHFENPRELVWLDTDGSRRLFGDY